MAVVTISREFGSGGDDVARRVAHLLGYAYFDKALMAEVAQEQGIAEAEVVDFSEDGYRLRSFVDALLGRSAPVAVASMWMATTHGVETKVAAQVDEEMASRFVAATIRALHEHDRVVVVGRGGQAILRGQPCVLHVRLVAGRQERIPTIMETEHLARLAATDLMVERDHATAEYLRRFYSIDWDDPLLYHLILNTSLLGQEGAARAIVAAVQHMECEASG
jgi:CMP/dCMP kinase